MSVPCCRNKRVLPTADSVRMPPVRGFVCTGCGTAWNMTETLWDRTAARLPVEYQDYFRNSEGMLALCAALNAGVPGVRRG